MSEAKPQKTKTIDDLTVRERKFIKFYMETGNASQAALDAGYKKRQSGYENLTRLVRNGLFEQFLEKYGLTDERIAKAIDEGLNAGRVAIFDEDGTREFIPDHATRHKFLETLLKVKQRIQTQKEDQEGQNIEVTVVNLIKQVNKEKLVVQPTELRVNERGTGKLDQFLAKTS